MIYQSRLKRLIPEKNKILNFQQQKNVVLVRAMVQNLDMIQDNVLCVEEMEE